MIVMKTTRTRGKRIKLVLWGYDLYTKVSIVKVLISSQFEACSM